MKIIFLLSFLILVTQFAVSQVVDQRDERADARDSRPFNRIQ